MDMTNPSIATTLLISLIGFATVFVVLVVLMGIIVLISKTAGTKKEAPVPVAEAPTPAEPAEKPYTGVKLHGVSDKEAAMLMAIVADQIGKPLDNLRFISIKEVK